LLAKSVLGFQLHVVGQAPRAARSGGFRESRLVAALSRSAQQASKP